MASSFTVYLVNHPPIELSKSDVAKVPRGFRRAVVTDLTTNKKIVLEQADCGLPGCMCRTKFAGEFKEDLFTEQ